MIEKLFAFSAGDSKSIEKLVDDDPVQINHIILAQNDQVPEHDSNSNVYLLIVRGQMTIRLGSQEPHVYQQGQIVGVPFRTRMNIGNTHAETLEFFVVKSPNPRHYGHFNDFLAARPVKQP